MEIELRAVREEEFEAWREAMAAAFAYDPRSEDLESHRAICEIDRTLAAFDGSQIVGTAGAFSYELTVPGGLIPAAGVTAVSVVPTHRRRGVLTAMMQRQLEDVHELGEPVAILWASESIIYGRFGYGMAADGIHFTIERHHTPLALEVESPGRVRLISKQEALETWPEVYDHVRRGWPGAVSRSPAWWEHETLRDPEHWRDGFTANRHLTYEVDGRPEGYARYRTRQKWEAGFPAGELHVGELMATHNAAYGALWRYLFGVDLMAKIEAHRRPTDEPLRWMLADPRRMVCRVSDSLWVRLVDVPTALAGRRYRVEGRVVLGVRDGSCPWNEGTYLLEGGPDGAECRPTEAEPEIMLSAADLGAAYLGRRVLATLRDASRVSGEEEAVRRAELMFAWSPAPWSPEVF